MSADAVIGGMTVTPYAGWRVIGIDHADAEDRVVVHEFPVGFRAKGSFDAGAWKLSPVVDCAFVPQTGDTKVRLAGTNTKSVISGDYAVTYRAGLSAEKGNLAFGLNYSGATGDSGLRSHSVQANMRLAF